MSEVTAVPLRPVARSGVVALWAGIVALVLIGIGGAIWASGPARNSAMPPEQFLAANARRAGVKTTASGLEYQVLKAGAGPTPGMSDVAKIEYVGKLVTGMQFDATPPGQTADLPVAGVVPGFAEAMMLMPKGAKYRIWLPPQLGYGDREAGPIPANSVLVFDIVMHDFMSVPAGMGGMPGAPSGQ